MLYGVVVLEGPFCFHAEDGTEIEPFGAAMEVPLFLRFYGKPPVVPGEIRNEEVVRCCYGADAIEPHLLHQSVL